MSNEETICPETAGETCGSQDSKAECQACKDLESRLEQEQHLVRRLYADFDNFRKQAQRRQREELARAEAEFAADLLPVLDNFERARQDAPQEEPWVQGMDLVYKQLLQILTERGLAPVDCKGLFDPNVHEAIAMLPGSNAEAEGTILQVTRAGYLYKGELLRAARVVVAGGSHDQFCQ